MTPQPGELTLEPAKRAKPPQHLADLDMTARREWLKEIGEPPFRADQLSRHYFERHVRLAVHPLDRIACTRAGACVGLVGF